MKERWWNWGEGLSQEIINLSFLLSDLFPLGDVSVLHPEKRAGVWDWGLNQQLKEEVFEDKHCVCSGGEEVIIGLFPVRFLKTVLWEVMVVSVGAGHSIKWQSRYLVRDGGKKNILTRNVNNETFIDISTYAVDPFVGFYPQVYYFLGLLF